MAGIFGVAWMLGSVSPLQVIRGMLDMSLRWWHESPLITAARVSLLIIAVWGLLNVAKNPSEGIIAVVVGVFGFYVLRRS
jgi:hypothetical protein